MAVFCLYTAAGYINISVVKYHIRKACLIGFNKIILGFSVGWSEELTPTISVSWCSMNSPQPTPK